MREWLREPLGTPLPASLTAINSRPIWAHLYLPASPHSPPDYFGVNSRQHATDDLQGKFL